jgi:membrane protease YdiL (CAAX protease family)
MLALAITVVVGIFAACIWCWAFAALKRSAGLPLIAWNKRRDVPWGLLDLVAVIALYIALTITIRLAIHKLRWLPETIDVHRLTLEQGQTLTLAGAVVSLLVLLIGLPLLAARSGANASDFGWSSATFLRDLALGVIAFVMLAPPVYLLQGVLVVYWKPSKHPLMEMFRETPDGRFFTILFFSAAIVAPLFEELLFRVLLQGFLEKLFTFRHSLPALVLGTRRVGSAVPSANPAEPEAPGDSSPALMAGGALPMEPNIEPELQPALCRAAAWLPIAISSIIFALLHYSHGPDWIPLTLLAMGIGYVYQRTHRLVPGLVVHAVLNSLSLSGLWLQVQEGIQLPGG